MGEDNRSIRKEYARAHLGDTVGLVADHLNKVTSTISESREVFGFPVHITFMFTLHCRLLNVHYV